MTNRIELAVKFPWMPFDAQVRSWQHARTAAQLDAVLDQFDIESKLVSVSRYAPHDGNTYCATLVWDATRAMGCEIPHWVDENLASTTPGQVSEGKRELNANAWEQEWMPKRGLTLEGWRRGSADMASSAAEVGQPVVAIWYNPPTWKDEKGVHHKESAPGRERVEHHGHTAMVAPAHGAKGVHVAQAGAKCYRLVPVETGFAGHQPSFYIHA